jgi:hypothetical protein
MVRPCTLLVYLREIALFFPGSGSSVESNAIDILDLRLCESTVLRFAGRRSLRELLRGSLPQRFPPLLALE